MTIRTAKELFCDGCMYWERLDVDMGIEWKRLKRLGWTRMDGKHFCPDCSKEMKGREADASSSATGKAHDRKGETHER